ncbi:uncharacterized protein LOC116257293 [Nymphaea colorata]|nr:uncharacterized protein LOC116257293 [Nymphaea colorata]
MPSSSLLSFLEAPVHPPSHPNALKHKIRTPSKYRNVTVFNHNGPLSLSWSEGKKKEFSGSHSSQIQQGALPLAVTISVLLCSFPAKAGILSGFSGLESVPGPQLPQVDFLARLNEENQKKYADFDARFKSSPLLKKLLEKSKLNREKNRQQILDKYCERGAEWGVGDCSTEGMTPEERDVFIKTLKKNSTAR